LCAGSGVETGRTRDTSASAAVPATAHRRFHVEKKERRGLPVILPETIVRRRCAALIPYARNARTHSDQQVAQIAASIREFGFTNPVLIDEEDPLPQSVPTASRWRSTPGALIPYTENSLPEPDQVAPPRRILGFRIQVD
jgi:hypothetical protein